MRALGKLIVGSTLLFFLAQPLCAQNITTVTATIADPNGLPYSNATVQAQLLPSGITPSIPPPCNGQTASPCFVSAFQQTTTDVTGTFSMNLASNAVLVPGGTVWQFTVNEIGVPPPVGTGPQTCSATVTVSGSSQSISSSFTCPALSNIISGIGALTNVINTFTVPQIFGADLTLRGPNPGGVDIRAFSAFAQNINTIPLTTCSISPGSLNIAVCANASGFPLNGGIAIVNAGPAQSITTPSAPTVTPSCASNLTGTGYATAAGLGTTPYSYQLVLRTTGQGITAASPVASTATGNAALGAHTAVWTGSVIGATNVMTVTVDSTANLAAGCLVFMKGSTDDQEYGGWHNIASIVDGTHFTFNSGMNAIYGVAAISSTGGSVFYWLCNDIAIPTPSATGFEALIYGRTGSPLPFLQEFGVPTNLGYTDSAYNHFQDFGSPMMDGATPPWWAPTNPPASPTNDTLSTVVTGKVGNTLTLRDPATQSVASAASRFDNVPAFVAAMNATSLSQNGGDGTIRIPVIPAVVATGVGCWPTSTYLTVTVPGVIQDGMLCPGDTIQFSGNWYGTDLSAFRLAGAPQTFRPHIPIVGVGGANPLIWIKNGGINKVTVNVGNNNGGIGVFAGQNATNQGAYDDDNFVSGGGSGDYMTIPFYKYNGTVSGGFGFNMRNVSCSTGPTQADGSTSTPCGIVKFDSLMNFDYMSGNRRGWFIDALASGLTGHFFMGNEIQGPVTPIVTLSNHNPGNVAGYFTVKGVLNDTGTGAMVANLPGPTSTMGAAVTVEDSNVPSSNLSLVTGAPFTSLFIKGVTATSISQIGQNNHICLYGGNSGSPLNTGMFCSELNLGSTLITRANPSISSGFGTTSAVVNANGSGFFQVNVGTGGVASSGVIQMNFTATHGWNCPGGLNQTAHLGNRADDTVQTNSTTTTVTVQNQTKSTGAAVAWQPSDNLQLTCTAN